MPKEAHLLVKGKEYSWLGKQRVPAFISMLNEPVYTYGTKNYILFL